MLKFKQKFENQIKKHTLNIKKTYAKIHIHKEINNHHLANRIGEQIAHFSNSASLNLPIFTT